MHFRGEALPRSFLMREARVPRLLRNAPAAGQGDAQRRPRIPGPLPSVPCRAPAAHPCPAPGCAATGPRYFPVRGLPDKWDSGIFVVCKWASAVLHYYVRALPA